ncbi:hypothetical protein BGZ95_005912, partial [Linnemannia exigua]
MEEAYVVLFPKGSNPKAAKSSAVSLYDKIPWSLKYTCAVALVTWTKTTVAQNIRSMRRSQKLPAWQHPTFSVRYRSNPHHKSSTLHSSNIHYNLHAPTDDGADYDAHDDVGSDDGDPVLYNDPDPAFGAGYTPVRSPLAMPSNGYPDTLRHLYHQIRISNKSQDQDIPLCILPMAR